MEALEYAEHFVEFSELFVTVGDFAKENGRKLSETCNALLNIGHWRIWGGACPAHAPPWDPILSFSHTFLPKSAHVGGPCPPNGCMPLLWEILDPPL